MEVESGFRLECKPLKLTSRKVLTSVGVKDLFGFIQTKVSKIGNLFLDLTLL